ncbi:MAG: glycosyl hydrolase family protein [Chitinophagaceae bacterium]|nr:MAG: glycosyl hydrolase family protein [Chitinophagaceae bacterium]
MKFNYFFLIFLFLLMHTNILSTKVFGVGVCDDTIVVPISDGTCDNNPWVLIFEDNFENPTLNNKFWSNTYPWGTINICNNEQQIYTSNNFSIENGILSLTAKEETVFGLVDSSLSESDTIFASCNQGSPQSYGINGRYFDYSSGIIHSNYSFHYGMFEIRCKIPKGKGFWPAFWLYSIPQGVNNEIDIFEFWNKYSYPPPFFQETFDLNKSVSRPNMTVHYDDDNYGKCGPEDYSGPDFSENFNTFTLVWDPYKIQWFVNGELKQKSYRFYTTLGQEVDCNGVNAFNSYLRNNIYPQSPMHIIANLAIQGPDGNKGPNSSTPFPSSLEIDYIRYWTKAPCDSLVEIKSNNDLNLSSSSSRYNFIVGKEILIEDDVHINHGQQVSFIASDKITVRPGFSAEAGSSVLFKIEECGFSSMRLSNSSSVENLNKFKEEDYFFSNEVYTTNDRKSKIEVKCYPSPNNGKFYISIITKENFDYIIDVYNVNGSKFKSKQISDSKFNQLTSINIQNFNSGIYFVKVKLLNGDILHTQKIIYQ